MVTTSAFGVPHPVAKVEYERGKYKPASQLSPAERSGYASDVRGSMHVRLSPTARIEIHQDRTAARHRDWAIREAGRKHSGALYAGAAEPEPSLLRGSGRTAHADQYRALMTQPTVASTKHRNVEYGASVHPYTRRRLDAALDVERTNKLRKPVVFHYGGASESAVASAYSPHVTRGGKGHIFINPAHYSPDLMPRSRGITASRTMAHELEHASSGSGYKTNRTMLQSAGEEARADARSGADLYMRHGHVPPAATRTPSKANRMRLVPAAPIPAGGRFGPEEIKRYHQVRAKIARAVKKVPR